VSETTTERTRASAPTLHDVARAAGVSLATASRVLNGSTRKVAETYRERVEAAAADLGYTANLSAQATARGTSAIIALLVADIADPYFGQIAAGVARGADEAGLVMTIAITERDPVREARLVRALRGQRPRGLILAASRTTESSDPTVQAELDALAATGGRVVALGPGAGEVRSVIIDNAGGARALGLALGERGYREAIVLAAGEGVLTSDDRTAGFTEGFAAAGGAVRRVYRGGFTRESGSQLMTEALRDVVPPGTLVFAISDIVAIGAMSAVRDAGRVVGDDIALCGFDDIPAGRDVTPGLTTVAVPLEDVGYRALRAAVDDDWDAAAGPLPLEVVLRGSTPVPPSA
jgi:LacI family transcriptional regulator